MANSVSGTLFTDLYYLYMGIALVVGLLIVGWLFYSLIRFRAKPGNPRPFDAPTSGTITAHRGHPIWSYLMGGLMALVLFGLAFGTISAIDTIETPPTDVERVHYNVTGYQFGWKYDYVGAGGVPFTITTPGSEQFTVPVDMPVVLNITSQDVWHNFAIPDFHIRVDAIPGTVNRLWFQSEDTGEFRNVCVVICGVNHANMHTMMRVVDRPTYDTWLAEQSEKAYGRYDAQYARDATRGTSLVANLSDAATLSVSGANFTAAKPIILLVNNADASPVTISLGDATLDVPAGGSARMYTTAPTTGSLDLIVKQSNAETARTTLEVRS